MTRERRELSATTWERVSEVFEHALSLTAAARARYVQEVLENNAPARQEVELMLAAVDSDVELQVEGKLLADLGAPGSLAAGSRVGGYVLDKLIGEGGMGEVYRAERVGGEFRQTVAVKVLRAGLRSASLIRRFQSERQILARLTHPSIVAVLDGGVTDDGRPYIVMQYVEGQPITTYCEVHQLSVEQRLRLFLRVATAVQFAHGRLVVHRDIKPSNIMVTPEGDVRLLDFGIAKLLSGDREASGSVTQSLLRLLTPEHAAPEQVRGEPVTTSTDVYALGVLLYQLLTGRPPHRLDGRPLSEFERDILTIDAEAPSAVVTDRRRQRQLSGDLDRITAMALRKEPERRYVSAAQLAEDVQRHLDGIPVLAEVDRVSYRLRKFVSRNRAVVGGVMAVVVLILAFGALSLQQARRIASERDRAEHAQASAESALALLTSLFERANPVLVPGGDTLRVRDFLSAAEQAIDTMGTQPAMQARLWRVVGAMYAARGTLNHARDLLKRSYDRQMSMPGSDSLDAIRTYLQLANVVQSYEGPDAARPLLQSAVTRAANLQGANGPLTREAQLSLAGTISDLRERRLLVERYLQQVGRTANADSMEVASGLSSQAEVLLGQGQYTQATVLFDEVVRMVETMLPRENPIVSQVMTNAAASHLKAGDLVRSEEIVRELLAIDARSTGLDSIAYSRHLETLGQIQALRGYHDDAEQTLREVVRLRRPALDRNAFDIWNVTRSLAIVVGERGRTTDAVALLDSSIAMAAASGAAPGPRGVLRGQRAMQLLVIGRTAEAARELHEVETIVRQAYDTNTEARAELELWLGVLSMAKGQPQDALSHFQAGQRILAPLVPPGHVQLAMQTCGAAVALAALGRTAEARAAREPACSRHAKHGTRNILIARWAERPPLSETR